MKVENEALGWNVPMTKDKPRRDALASLGWVVPEKEEIRSG